MKLKFENTKSTVTIQNNIIQDLNNAGTVILALPSEMTIKNNANLTVNSMQGLTEFDISDSEVTIELGLCCPAIKLKDSKLNLKFTYKDKEYNLIFTDTATMDISSKEFVQLANLCSIDKVKLNEKNVIEVASIFRGYGNFGNKSLLQKFIECNLGKNVHEIIELFTNEHFLALNTVSKSLKGSDLEMFPKDIMMNITSYLKPGDIKLAGENADNHAQEDTGDSDIM